MAHCDHAVTVAVGPALRVCTVCGKRIEKLPEPSGCESEQCEQS